MLDRHEKQPGWLNQPYKLSMAEVENPLTVVEDFFEHDHLYGNRDTLWEMLKSTVTGNYAKRLTGKEKENMVAFYEMLERLIESCYLINEYSQSGKLRFNKATSQTDTNCRSEEEHPDEYNPIIEGIDQAGNKIPEIEKIFLIKYHSRIDYTASFLILTHSNVTSHEQLERSIREHFSEEWPVNILIRTATEVYNFWKDGNIFYNRVCWKERLKYDAGNTLLPSPKIYSLQEVKGKAINLYERIGSVVPGFLLGAQKYAEGKHNALSAFSLHQAAEHAMRALLISILGFAPHTHTLGSFLQASLFLTEELIGIFHEEDIKGESSLYLLNKSYVKARYVNQDAFIITDDDLNSLHSKVTELVKAVSKVFNELINEVGQLSSSPYFTKDFDL